MLYRRDAGVRILLLSLLNTAAAPLFIYLFYYENLHPRHKT